MTTPPRTRDAIIGWTLRWEGSGYTDHPHDRGGPTKYGLTLRTLQGLGSLGDVDRDGDIDRADVQLLDHGTAVRIYRHLFWGGIAGEQLLARDWRVALVCYDAAVHSGAGWSARRLQDAVGVRADGQIGPATLAALDTALRDGPAGLLDTLLARRVRLWRGLLERDARQWTFARGWANRLDDLCATVGVAWPRGLSRTAFLEP